MHYAPSAVTNTTHRTLATGLIIGQRVPPHVFIRAADARPFELQDLLPSDTRFKVLAFVGNAANEWQRARITSLAEELENTEGFVRKFGGKNPNEVVDLLAISSSAKEQVNYTDVPAVFRSHWSK